MYPFVIHAGAKGVYSAKVEKVSRMSDLPDSGAGVAEEGDDDKVAEKLDPQKMLHLRCAKCQAFFRGVVYKCGRGHSTCSLCCNMFWYPGCR